jgi:hypothetical protein
MKRSTLITIGIATAFFALLLYSTLSSQHMECTVTVEFRGLTNTATASAEDEAEALRHAQQTACGPISSGMDESIACGKVVPVVKTCRAV